MPRLHSSVFVSLGYISSFTLACHRTFLFLWPDKVDDKKMVRVGKIGERLGD
jgi:hypothetical protein